MSRAALILPGRGSYTERSMGAIDPSAPLTLAAEALRAELGLPSIAELDRAPRFDPAVHLRPANAAVLIYLCSWQDVERVRRERELVCVLGNSMGWYSALAAAGALTAEEGLELIQRMALLQESGQGGGQLIYPLVNEDWQFLSERSLALERVLAAHPGELFPSIRLGGYAVLAGSELGLRAALAELPKLQQSRTSYPFRLMQHGPYHSPLAESVAAAARSTFSGLSFRRPKLPLIDGLGRRFTPWSADTAEIWRYTLGQQVVGPYDFSASLLVALREYAPAELILTGPGNTLGGVCGQILIREGWQTLHSRSDFDTRQKSSNPIVWSLGR